VAEELAAEMALREAALLEMEAEIRTQIEGRREAEAAAAELRDRLQDADRLQERLQVRLSGHAEQMRAEVRKLELLQDELEALDRRLARSEEIRGAKEEMLRDAQLELHQERVRVQELEAALKEKAELGLELENEHHAQLHFHQQALARALQAHRAARGEPMPAEWVVLRGPAARAQASTQQVAAALEWAQELMSGVRHRAATSVTKQVSN
jgi:DNA repair exonuclease SbcCD ATPase subunit